MNHKTRILTGQKATFLLATAALLSACGEESNSSAPDSIAEAAASVETSQSSGGAASDQASEPVKMVQAVQYATEGGLQDIVIGSADAPVEIIEYASLTCSHCATFHATTYPDLKKNYLDTGKARLVFRHFVMNPYDMVATQIARCDGVEKAPAMVSTILSNQRRWINEDYLSHLTVLARRAGIGKEQVDSCVADQKTQQQLIDMRQHGIENYQVNATPTLIINGEKFEGSRDIATLGREIDKAL